MRMLKDTFSPSHSVALVDGKIPSTQSSKSLGETYAALRLRPARSGKFVVTQRLCTLLSSPFLLALACVGAKLFTGCTFCSSSPSVYIRVIRGQTAWSNSWNILGTPLENLGT